MAQCPFCRANIDERLAVDGGTCPSCFGQIPGEDAPTDPGAAVRARQEAQDRKVVARSRIPALIGVFAVFGLVCSAGYVVLRPTPPLPKINFDDADFDFPELVIHDAPDEPVAAPDPLPGGPGRAPPRPNGLSQLAGSPDGSAGMPNLPDAVAAGDPGGGGTRRGLGTDATGPEGLSPTLSPISQGGLGGGPDLSGVVRRNQMRGVTLTDDNQIVQMLRDTLTDEIPRLNTCYTRALRQYPDLRGSWTLDLVVQADGTARDIVVTGQEMQNEELESCVTEKVTNWHFSRIRADQPVRKTLRFRPG